MNGKNGGRWYDVHEMLIYFTDNYDKQYYG